MIIKYMTFSFAFTSRAGQAAVDDYCKFWVKEKAKFFYGDLDNANFRKSLEFFTFLKICTKKPKLI